MVDFELLESKHEVVVIVVGNERGACTLGA